MSDQDEAFDVPLYKSFWNSRERLSYYMSCLQLLHRVIRNRYHPVTNKHAFVDANATYDHLMDILLKQQPGQNCTTFTHYVYTPGTPGDPTNPERYNRVEKRVPADPTFYPVRTKEEHEELMTAINEVETQYTDDLYKELQKRAPGLLEIARQKMNLLRS